jgi:hypothetical protein
MPSFSSHGSSAEKTTSATKIVRVQRIMGGCAANGDQNSS